MCLRICFQYEKPGRLPKWHEGGYLCHDYSTCNETFPPGMCKEGNANLRNGGSFLMNLFMKMD